ncbi:hypothetical protein [Lewinella cohaerens]|uniref:hypothetical protein n=1 Tax=Lewinella cohaerens TaxID=70995 RepID=UPI00036C9CE1|nr:hypothetical protein [Lewinella cohaerens]
MINYELKTQIFYLNRMFELLSNGYMFSVISFHKTEGQGDPNIPFTQINDKQKRNLQQVELEILLDLLFDELYKHSKQFALAPEIFNQSWNNEFVLKSITETKKNIIEYAVRNQRVIKTGNDIIKDQFQVIEFVCENEKMKEVLFFQTWFH